MVKEAEITAQAVQAEVEKILASQTLRGKETLRSLLSYLVEKTLNGSTETLKEYTIGVEAFGKLDAVAHASDFTGSPKKASTSAISRVRRIGGSERQTRLP